MKNKHSQFKERPLVSIIIAVYGRFDLLTQCLDAIPKAANNIKYEIILVDNNSPERVEADTFYSGRDDFILIRNRENQGFPRACNQGARRSSAPLLFFLNSDVILKEKAIDHLVRDLDDPKIGVAGMLLLFPEYAEGLDQKSRPAGKVQHAGMDTNIHGRFIHTFVGWEADNPKVLAQRECYAVTGAALMTRKMIFMNSGCFNEAYGLGTYEDVDFCMSVREAGYNIIVDTKAVGTHYTGATAEFFKIGYPMDQNRLIFLQKWSNKLKWTEWERW